MATNQGMGRTLGCDLLLNPGDLTYNSTSANGTKLGSLGTTGDGRYFRFVLAGASNLVPGKLCSAPAETTNWQDLDVAAAAVGDTTITTTSTVTVTANQLAGGFVVVTNGTGAGYTYQIDSHPAATGAVVTLTLKDSVQSAIGTNADIDLIASNFSGVVLAAASLVAEPVGVAVFPITAAQYGWIQVRGPVGCLVDAGNVTVGVLCVQSDDTDGAVGPYETDAITSTVGTAMTGGSSGEYSLIDLRIS